MIFDLITKEEQLFLIRRYSVSENGVGVTIHSDLMQEDGYLIDEKICILKLDKYFAYNSRQTHNPPKVIDNLVIVKCCDGSVSLYLIELRKSNGKKPTKRLKPSEIEGKFITAVGDFLGVRHAGIFKHNPIKRIRAYLVADPWGYSEREDGKKLFGEKLKLSSLDAYSSLKPLVIFGRSVFIRPVLPPEPVIGPC